jgi:DNA polymerase III epsilon subunit-like protein
MLNNKYLKEKPKIPLPEWDTQIDNLKFAIIDTETCGIWNGSRIVEIAFTLIENLEIKESRAWLVNPGRKIPDDVIKIHGITNEKVKDEPGIFKVLSEMFPILEGFILVAHHSPYDEAIISTDAARYGFWVPGQPILDTRILAKNLLPGRESYSLSNLASFLEIHGENFHRAESDTKVTAELFIILMKKLKTMQEFTFNYLKTYGNISYMGTTGKPVDFYPPRFQFLSLAIKTQADVEIQYSGSNGEITIPGTLLCSFHLGRHNYIEIRDHRNNDVKTLRIDRIINFFPVY